MNSHETQNRATGAAAGFVIAILLFAALIVGVKISMRAPAIDEDRGALISKTLFEIRTNETASLENAGWIDQPRGIVRLPIETAMQMTERNWQNPAAARADLISRAERASAPVAAPKPTPFE